MPGKKKMTKEDADKMIAQLEDEIEKLNERIKQKKARITELKEASHKLNQERILDLVLSSGKDYSELVEILSVKEK